MGSLERIVGLLVTPGSGLTVPQKRQIINDCLYFTGLVSNEVVITIISSLSQTRPHMLSPVIQRMLVEWLHSVASFLEDSNILPKLYGVLFNCLEFEHLSLSVAKLLISVTQYKLVTVRRVQCVQKLMARAGDNDHLISLLLVYKSFRPDLVPKDHPASAKYERYFKRKYSAYQQKLMSLQGPENLSRINYSQFTEAQQNNEVQERVKRRKRSSMRLAQDEILGTNSVNELALKFKSWKLPKDSLSVVNESNNLSLITLIAKCNETQKADLDKNILLSLENFSSMKEHDLTDSLNSVWKLIKLQTSTPESLLNLLLNEEFIMFVMKSEELFSFVWRFFRYLSVELTELQKIHEFYDNVFNKTKNIEFYSSFLDCYTGLCGNWLKTNKMNESMSALVQKLIQNLNFKLTESNYHKSFAISIITFFNVFKLLPPESVEIKCLILPPPLLTSLFFMNDPLIISQLCQYLNFCKEVLENTKLTKESQKYAVLYNHYVIDITNVLWRNRAFEIRVNDSADYFQNTSFGLNFKFISTFKSNFRNFDKNSSFNQFFNLFHSPAFSFKLAKIIKSIEDSNKVSYRFTGPFNENLFNELKSDDEIEWLELSLNDLYKLILEGLEQDGYVGLTEFLCKNLKSLMKLKNGSI